MPKIQGKHVYFFAEQQIEFAFCNSLNTFIKNLYPQIKSELIYSREPRSNNYNIDSFIESFDRACEVEHTSFWKDGMWREGFTIRNILNAIRKIFPSAIRLRRELNKFRFQSNSIAFLFSGISLNKALLLRRIKGDSNIKSVLITSPDLVMNKTESEDFFLHRSRSSFLNFHLYFFGTAFLDVYWLKTPEGIRTNWRELYYRKKPADYVFEAIYPYRYKRLNKQQLFIPLFNLSKKTKILSNKTLIFIGQPHFWIEPYSSDIQKIFYLRLNEIIFLIKKKHPLHRLIYKRHPSENDQKFKRINTKGFEIESSISSESLFIKDPSITALYAFCSASVQTASCFGISSYYIYNLFDDLNLNIPETYIRQRSYRFCSEIHPEMNIKSIDDWMDGKNDYKPQDVKEKVYNSTLRMLEKVGTLESVPEKN